MTESKQRRECRRASGRFKQTSVAAIFAEPEPILRIHVAAARRRPRRRRLEQRDFAGPGVDAADLSLPEIGGVDVVL